MSNRPPIPAEIRRQILVESGHQCAVCGTRSPLEVAHIIPWHKSKQHKAENLICLCANYHELADQGKWGEKTLKAYKQKPYVLRQGQGADAVDEPSGKIDLMVAIEMKDIDETCQKWLRYALAGFLDISPKDVLITSIEEGSVKITIELPAASAAKLLQAYDRSDADLGEYLAPFDLIHLRRHVPARVGEAMSRQDSYDVFLSHNSADKPAVEAIAKQLMAKGLKPWLDKWNLVPGEPWQPAIEAAMGQCAACAVFIGPDGRGPWQDEEMRAAIDHRVADPTCKYRVIPVLLPGAQRGQRGRLPPFLLANAWVKFPTLEDDHALYRLACGIRGESPGLQPGESIIKGTCPYRGLQMFDVDHVRFFFGREALTEWLLNALDPTRREEQAQRFLGIIGASGSGKSSLARAGLVAAVKQGQLPGSDRWPVAICRPGADPLENLAVALSKATGADVAGVKTLMDALREDGATLHRTAELALHDAPADARLLVLIDQFEETFTLCPDESSRRAFIDNLIHANQADRSRAIIVLTMRADYYDRCAVYPNLSAALADHQLLLGPLSEDEFRQAIERPAQLVGCELEPGLTELLLRDVADQVAGGLPLLQHALLELWERRKANRLTRSAYRAIGGIAGALEQRAEHLFGQLDVNEREICRGTFLRLIQPGEGAEYTKRRAELTELLPDDATLSDATRAVIFKLSDAHCRLITIDSMECDESRVVVEVAHEALIRGWGRLRGWIESDLADLRTHRELTKSANQWQEQHDESFLYRGVRLVQAEEWAEQHLTLLNSVERRFVEASIASRDLAERRRQRLLQGFAGLGAVGLLLAVTAFGFAFLMLREKNKAEVASTAAKAARQEAIVLADTNQDLAERERDARQEAQRRFHEVRAAVDAWLTGTSEALKYFPNMRATRIRLLQKAAKEYERFAKQRSDNPSLELECGRAYLRLGEVYVTLGEVDKAREAYGSAGFLFKGLSQNHPDVADYRLEQANSQTLLGLVLEDIGEHADALQAYDAAVSALRPLVPGHPYDPRFRLALGVSLLDRGVLLARTGPRQEGEETVLEAVRQLQQLTRDWPEEQKYKMVRATAQITLGQILAEQGRCDDALAQLDQAIQSFDAAAQNDSEAVRPIESRADARIYLASVLRKLGRYNEERDAYRKAIADYEALDYALPDVPLYRESLAITWTGLGHLLYRLGHAAEAEAELNRALPVFTSLATEYPRIPRYYKELAACHDNLGQVLLDLDRDEESESQNETALKIFEQLAEEFPDVDEYRHRLAVSRRHLGQALHKLGEQTEAAREFREAIMIFDDLIQAAPDTPSYRDELAFTCCDLGVLLEDDTDTVEREKAFSRANDLWHTLTLQSLSSEYSNNLAWFLVNCADPQFRNAEEAIICAKRATNAVSDNADYHNTSGVAHYRAGDWQTAIQMLGEAISLRKEGNGRDWFFLSMAQWESNLADEAVRSYEHALQWMDENRPGNLELQRIRREAAALLKVVNEAAPPKPPAESP